ncbi:MAG: hypothetical protein ACREPM_06300 [Gemmatimonadaceae bacterium]
MVALAAAFAGCGSDSNTAPTGPNTSVNVPALVAAASNTTYGSLARSLALAPVIAIPAVNTSACSYSSTDQEFVCPTATSSGLTMKSAFQLLDANGNPLSVADAATLAAVRTIIDVDGTTSFVSTTSGTVSATTVHSHSDNTLSGLLTDKHTLNGATSERDTISTVFGGITTKLALTATTAVSSLDIPTTAGAYPATGSITTDAGTTETFGSAPPFASNTHVVVAFNGTSVVTITLGIGASTQRCTLDLAHASNLSCTAG